MLVRISIKKPLTDQSFPRSPKYKTIKIIKAKREITPSNTLTGYEIGCLDISPKATIVYHIRAHTNPIAPTNDIPKESSVVFILHVFITVFAKIKQNNAETTRVTPNEIPQNGKPRIKRQVKNSAVGESAPPIMPIAPF